MIEINDILTESVRTCRVIDAVPENDYIVTLLQSDIDGPVDQDSDNIGEFVLKSDILDC